MAASTPNRPGRKAASVAPAPGTSTTADDDEEAREAHAVVTRPRGRLGATGIGPFYHCDPDGGAHGHRNGEFRPPADRAGTSGEGITGSVRRMDPIARAVGAAVVAGLLAVRLGGDGRAAHTSGHRRRRAPEHRAHPHRRSARLRRCGRCRGRKRLLAAHGVKFTSFYDSVSLCCPARATLLTGRYAHSTSVYANAPPSGGAATFRQPPRRPGDAGGLAAPRGLPNRPLREVPERLPGRIRPTRVGRVHHVVALLGRRGVRAGRQEGIPADDLHADLPGGQDHPVHPLGSAGRSAVRVLRPVRPARPPEPRAALCAHARVLELSRLADPRLRRARPVGQAAVRATATVHAGRAEGRAPLPQAADTHASVGRRDG